MALLHIKVVKKSVAQQNSNDNLRIPKRADGLLGGN